METSTWRYHWRSALFMFIIGIAALIAVACSSTPSMDDIVQGLPTAETAATPTAVADPTTTVVPGPTPSELDLALDKANTLLLDVPLCMPQGMQIEIDEILTITGPLCVSEEVEVGTMTINLAVENDFGHYWAFSTPKYSEQHVTMFKPILTIGVDGRPTNAYILSSYDEMCRFLGRYLFTVSLDGQSYSLGRPVTQEDAERETPCKVGSA